MNINDLVKAYPGLKPMVKRLGEQDFYPPQVKAFNSGFLDGKNLLLASPTSSGKTRVAEVAMMLNKSRGGKSLYLVPLRSLAREKYDDFRELYDGLMSVGLSIGDLTKGDELLGRNDLIICSYEKFDSLLRHRASWIKDVSLVVVDEVHLLDDQYRGPTIEVLLTRLKELGVWIVSLSATIGNPEEFGEWLDALVVKSDFRPVKLLQGLMSDNVVEFKDEGLTYDSPSIAHLCGRVINQGKQALVFVNTRRSAESVAEKLGLELKLDTKALNELSKQVLNALPSPTSQCRRLAECVKHGVVFNHAGLVSAQKQLIESGFRQGLIKVIACTTVLAYGVSLPAYMVVLRDLKRYTGEGMQYIPVSEYLQVIGRAGRSGYDVKGESVVVVGSESESDYALTNYLGAQPTSIVSKLGVEPVLRFHALSLVCDGTAMALNSLVDFFKASFFGFNYGSDSFLQERVELVVKDLVDYGFVKLVNDKLIPTRLGVRVNELYIDPLSAWRIVQALGDVLLNPLAFIHLACSCGEVRSLRLRNADYTSLLEELALNEDKLMIQTPSPFSYEYEGFIRAFKTSLMLQSWINEVGEDQIMSDYFVPPGMLHNLLKNLEWVLYAIGEIAEIKGCEGVRQYVNGLITRVRYGIKSELLNLVSLRGVGRVRARKLYARGLKSVSDLRKTGLKSLAKILGPGIAKKVLDSLD